MKGAVPVRPSPGSAPPGDTRERFGEVHDWCRKKKSSQMKLTICELLFLIPLPEFYVVLFDAQTSQFGYTDFEQKFASDSSEAHLSTLKLGGVGLGGAGSHRLDCFPMSMF